MTTTTTLASITSDLADLPGTVRCAGDFYVAGSTEIAAPNLRVDGVGLLSLPFQQGQLEQLIVSASASLAPFGRGGHTVVDTTVRKTWQIDAAHLHFSGRHWQTSPRRPPAWTWTWPMQSRRSCTSCSFTIPAAFSSSTATRKKVPACSPRWSSFCHRCMPAANC